ncbi:MAG: DUF5696 domain-containing protein [Clostridiales bacterium]|jgi:hypothetical protein|nr:DUF5696 domain-containing protein [Clostridiales bacterium]
MRKMTGVALIIICLFAGACGGGTETASQPVVIDSPAPFEDFELTMFNEFVLVCENDEAELWADTEYSNFKVVSKETGAFYETKQLYGSEGNDLVQNSQKSDFTFTYITSRVEATTKMLDNYSMSLAFYQAEYERMENGVRCYYLIGEKDRLSLDLFPYFISMERLEALVLQYLDDDQRDEMLDNFYTVTSEKVVRKWAPYTKDGKPNVAPQLALGRMNKYFYELGKYTPEELAKDNAQWEQEPPATDVFFRFTVEYTLDGKDLTVRMPLSEMLSDDRFPVSEVTLTPYLLSGGAEDEGYLFVPDGSGGVIDFNEGDPLAPVLQMPVYGDDPLRAPFFYKETFNPATLPVVGIKKNGIALLGVIEGGAEIATVSANVAGKMDEFNKVNVSFNLLYVERLIMTGGGSSSPKYLDAPYGGDLAMRYIFLEGEQADYTGMAGAYKEYLREREMLKRNEPSSDAPFFVEMVATAAQERMFLGFPVTEYDAATSAAQAEEILRDLQGKGIGNIQAQYTAWANKGVKNEPLTKVSVPNSIGGGKGVTALAAFASENGIGFYPAVRLQSVGDKLLGGFTASKDYARTIDNDYAPRTYFDIANRTVHLTHETYLIPHRLPQYAQTIGDNMAELGLGGLGITDAGTLLYGSYGKKTQLMRAGASGYVSESLRNLESSGLDLLFSNANAYALPFASAVTDLPVTGSGRRAISRSVPFAQMVLNNDVPYSMVAYNADMMSWDGFDEYLLKAVETRSALKFIFTAEPELMFGSALKKANSEFVTYEQPFYYMTRYARWADAVGEYYARFNDFYRRTAGAEIAAHEETENGLVSVKYSNGVTVLINYGETDVSAGGHTVPAKAFVIAE